MTSADWRDDVTAFPEDLCVTGVVEWLTEDRCEPIPRPSAVAFLHRHSAHLTGWSTHGYVTGRGVIMPTGNGSAANPALAMVRSP